jgi:hypothetical protein
MIDDAWGHWFAGFFDGEGCFTVKPTHRARRTATYVCSAEITLRADDAAILYEIVERTGIGRVHDKRGGDDPRRPNPFSRWQFGKQAEARALVAIFDRYPLRAKKARDYAAWRRAVLAHAAGDFVLLEAARQELQRCRKYEAPPPSDLEPLARVALFEHPPEPFDWTKAAAR